MLNQKARLLQGNLVDKDMVHCLGFCQADRIVLFLLPAKQM